MICDLLSIAETAFQTYIVPHAVFYLLLVCEDFLLSLPPLMVTLYLLHCCSEDMHTCKLLHAALCLWILSLVLVISFPFIGGFIYFTPDNHYYRGPLYPLLPIPTIVILLLNFIGTMRRRALLSRKTFLSFVIAEVPMTTAPLRSSASTAHLSAQRRRASFPTRVFPLSESSPSARTDLKNRFPLKRMMAFMRLIILARPAFSRKHRMMRAPLPYLERTACI